MKNLLCILLCCTFLTACSSDKRIAPKEGRISLSPQAELVSTKKNIQLDTAKNPSEWGHLYQNAQNKHPHIQGITNKTKLWTVDIGANYSEPVPQSPIVVSNDAVYTLDGAFGVSKIDKKTGQSVWHKKLPVSSGKGIGLTTDGNQIFVIFDQGTLVALKSDGEIAWQKELAMPIRTTPTFNNRLLFVLSAKNVILALDKKTGKEVWRYQTTPSDTFLQGMAHPALSQNILIVPFTTGEVIAFDAASGMLIWSQTMIGNQLEDLYELPHILAAPVISGNTVYLAGNANLLGAYNLQTGQTKWTHNIGSVVTPVLSGNVLFVLSKNNHLLALEATTGRIFWDKEIPHNKKTNWQELGLTDNHLVLYSDDKELYIDSKSGEIQQELDKKNIIAGPISTENTIFYLTNRAKLQSYQQVTK
ncbi:MAG: PQQ-binding-like beta-propeller repeat protein [Alphaproteobacteria bacterium]|nr:PQQ-binding-like beta-propeller repeat protein [Alphaproteobacteria bacterium]